MAAVAERSTFRLIVFAAAETDLLLLIRILVIAFECKLEGLVGAALLVVRSIAEWLILRSTASAVVVSLALLESHLVWLSLSNLSLFAIHKFDAIFTVSLFLRHNFFLLLNIILMDILCVLEVFFFFIFGLWQLIFNNGWLYFLNQSRISIFLSINIYLSLFLDFLNDRRFFLAMMLLFFLLNFFFLKLLLWCLLLFLNLLLLLSELVEHILDGVHSSIVSRDPKLVIPLGRGLSPEETWNIAILYNHVSISWQQRVLLNAIDTLSLLNLVQQLSVGFLLSLDESVPMRLLRDRSISWKFPLCLSDWRNSWKFQISFLQNMLWSLSLWDLHIVKLHRSLAELLLFFILDLFWHQIHLLIGKFS